MNGWIKLHRQLLDNWLSGDPDAMAVWVRLLMEANHKSIKRMFNGALVDVERGQLIFGLPAFSAKSGVSISKLRRILSALESDDMISRQKTNKYSIITILCFDKYQCDDRQTTGEPQANDKQTAGKSQHRKNVKNDKKKELIDFSAFGFDDNQISELKRIRKKNKGGEITQRVADGLAKEFNAARSLGFTVDDLLTEWEMRGWKSFKAEWVKTKQGEKNENTPRNLSAIDRVRKANREAAIKRGEIKSEREIIDI